MAVLIGLAFRSVSSALISFLPSLFPVVATGAVLWALGQGVEFASVVALIIIFGLGVDALLHFLNRLTREEKAGEDPALAIRRARVLVGPAIILTTVVLAFGLGVTVFSDLPSLRLFGARLRHRAHRVADRRSRLPARPGRRLPPHLAGEKLNAFGGWVACAPVSVSIVQGLPAVEERHEAKREINAGSG